MKLKLKRIARKPNYTIGKLYIDGSYFCDVLEDTDRGLKDSMTEVGITKLKVKGKTAIPIGTYSVLWTYSIRFKKYMPLIDKVKGFSGIRIHAGNTHEDTEGCLLLGYNKVVGKVLNSKETCVKFYKIIEPAIKEGKVTITIE